MLWRCVCLSVWQSVRPWLNGSSHFCIKFAVGLSYIVTEWNSGRLYPGITAKGTFLWNVVASDSALLTIVRVYKSYLLTYSLCPELWTSKKSPRHVDRRQCCQLSLTDDRLQFITLIIHLRVRRYWRDERVARVHLRHLRVAVIWRKLAPDLQNILRQSYDYLTIMPKIRSTYDDV